VPYWSARAAAEQGPKHPFEGSEREAIEQLDALLADAVKLRMVADVPLGAFLSGGIDSSTIASLMQAQSSRPVKTFSIGFHEAGYNEAVYAAAVARHLGTDHTELYVTSDEAMAVIPQLPLLYDEPFADSSQIPTYLVSKLARRDVTVSLSGDGGDEVFGGYTRYFWAKRVWNSMSRVPGFLRRPGASALTALSPGTWNRVFQRAFQSAGPLLPGGLRQSHPGDKLHKLATLLNTRDPETMYLRLVSVWKDALSLVPGAHELPTVLTQRDQWLADPEIAHKMMFLDTVTYLPDDILAKVDRASMGVSLESRVPFLDHRVVEFAWRLPIGLKVRGGQGKWLLRQVLKKYVPRELVERPKIGFGVPIHAWLRGPLREWAESLIDPTRMLREGYLNPEPVQRKWREHLSGKQNCADALWGVLMFQAWLENENVNRSLAVTAR
nr:asparagine synthase C-terminal domain-containing protein [Acidobacteriota bacterium]